jgi:hypothetical protein
MGRRFVIGVLWSAAIYFGACLFVGVVACIIAGACDPAHATAAGIRAGAVTVASMRIYLIFCALFVGTAGTMLGFLPDGGATARAVPSRHNP